MNDKILNWLREFPGLELLQHQQVEAVDGGCGLYFRGVTGKDSQPNLLGQTKKQKTAHFRLCRYGQRVESAVFFLLLGSWVEIQGQTLGADAAAAQNGTTPLVSDATAAQNGTTPLVSDVTAALKNARSVRDTGSGLTLWEADLEITYWEAAA